MQSRRSTLRACTALALAAFLCGCLPSEQEDAASEDPYSAPLTVQLRGVVAGVIGEGILLQNHSPEALENVEIVINPGANGGGFRFRTERIDSNSTKSYTGRVFRNDAGLSFEDADVEPNSFAVYADTPRGRGSWAGQYGPAGN